MAERSKAAVLKTVDLRGSVGSNPTSSAKLHSIFMVGGFFLIFLAFRCWLWYTLYMEIRRTQKTDLEQLPYLYRQNYCGETDAHTDVQGMLKKFKKLQRNKDYVFVSAVEEDKLVGFCEGVLNYEIIENQKPVLTVWNVRVLPEFRRQGVGESLMGFLEKFAKDNNAVGVFLGCDFENKMAQSFYKKIGYKENFGYFKLLK